MTNKMGVLGVVMMLGGCDLVDGQRWSTTDELTPLEAHLVGVWKGDWGDGTVGYLVLNEDRTACDWMREGDDYFYRHNHTQHVYWSLNETLEDNDRMILELTTEDGDVWTYDRYDPFEDQILAQDNHRLAMSWQDFRIACTEDGMAIVETDIARGGSPYDTDDDQSHDEGSSGSEPSSGSSSSGGGSSSSGGGGSEPGN